MHVLIQKQENGTRTTLDTFKRERLAGREGEEGLNTPAGPRGRLDTAETHKGNQG